MAAGVMQRKGNYGQDHCGALLLDSVYAALERHSGTDKGSPDAIARGSTHCMA
jgi:hypothetical protein